MNGQVTDLFGIYLPSFGLILAAAFALLLPLRWLLARVGLYNWFWHRGIVDLSLLILLSAGLLFLLASGGQSP